MGLSKVSYNYTSTWDGIRSVIRTDGFRGLFQGAVPNCKIHFNSFSNLTWIDRKYRFESDPSDGRELCSLRMGD